MRNLPVINAAWNSGGPYTGDLKPTTRDDLGRTYSIIIETFRPKRRRAFHHPWKHDHDPTYVIVDWP